ncbi:hypothetical protein NDU88_002786 [Pleurodeles waltl]|uniref:Uncharacterized protein n=1 Tax=Pleurodeles waltl TaxID=8319 RepID=A0AAV7UWP0_PLEWA|nr:hypothetical protein NDU88_002786 [Pleurodeles waltl]
MSRQHQRNYPAVRGEGRKDSQKANRAERECGRDGKRRTCPSPQYSWGLGAVAVWFSQPVFFLDLVLGKGGGPGCGDGGLPPWRSRHWGHCHRRVSDTATYPVVPWELGKRVSRDTAMRYTLPKRNPLGPACPRVVRNTDRQQPTDARNPLEVLISDAPWHGECDQCGFLHRQLHAAIAIRGTECEKEMNRGGHLGWGTQEDTAVPFTYRVPTYARLA